MIYQQYIEKYLILELEHFRLIDNVRSSCYNKKDKIYNPTESLSRKIRIIEIKKKRLLEIYIDGRDINLRVELSNFKFSNDDFNKGKYNKKYIVTFYDDMIFIWRKKKSNNSITFAPIQYNINNFCSHPLLYGITFTGYKTGLFYDVKNNFLLKSLIDNIDIKIPISIFNREIQKLFFGSKCDLYYKLNLTNNIQL